MSRTTVTMPQLGESVVEGTVGQWLKAPGEAVGRFESLVEVVTDKVNTEIPSPVAGVLVEVLVEEGATVSVGTPLAVLEVEGGASGAAATEEQPAAASGAGAAPAGAAVTGTAAAAAGAVVAAVPTSGGGVGSGALPRGVYSPLVRRLAQEHGIDLLQVQGSGAGGRVTKRDVLAVVEAGVVSATPSIGQAPATAPTHRPQPVAAAAAAPAPEPGDQVLTPDAMRRAIAQHMVVSKQTIPHAWTMMEADVSDLVALRAAKKDAFAAAEGVGLTFVPFFIKAVVEGIKQFPHVNSTWQDDRITVKKRINIGVAIGLDDGLVVPVIHDADRLSIAGLAQALAELIERARTGKLTVNDVQGGTFTVNNTGAFGSVASYPIINNSQAAILTMETIRRTPVAIGDAIGIRSLMNMCLSFDHRVTDGLYVGRFLQTVKAALEGYGPETSLY